MRFFLAGIMQGSHRENLLHDQGYRPRLKALLCQHFPGSHIYDPLADHTNSLAYDDETGRKVFCHHNQMCGQVDVVIAFVPEASMGTAVEMWEAWRNGRVVVSISPLVHNWAVKFLSHVRYTDAADFELDVATGVFAQRITAAQREIAGP